MKKKLSPLMVVGTLGLVLLSASFVLWKQYFGSEGTGRIESNLGPAERDPVKLKQRIEELVRQEREAKGKK